MSGVTGIHPVNRTLLALLENQAARTEACFEDLPAELCDREPGGDCNTIRSVAAHLLALRRFQLALLESPLAEKVPEPHPAAAPEDLLDTLRRASDLLAQALREHDPDDWYAIPDPPRPGHWGDEATLPRFVRPFNDFVNHLGAIRALRRVFGHPAPRTQ